VNKIYLSQGKFAIVDDEDFEWLSKWKWSLCSGYAVRKIYLGNIDGKYKSKRFSMHREIMKVSKELKIDHINRNRIDNRKINLRTCNATQNLMNKKHQKNSASGIKGVRWREDIKKWHVEIQANKKRFYLGVFIEMSDAINAYNDAAKKYHGEFAFLNDKIDKFIG
jgi:hypothetical protein